MGEPMAGLTGPFVHVGSKGIQCSYSNIQKTGSSLSPNIISVTGVFGWHSSGQPN